MDVYREVFLLAFALLQVSQEEMEYENMITNDMQDCASPKAAENVTDDHHPEEMIPESTDVSMEDDTKTDDKAEGIDMKAQERTSPNISLSADLVSGTPQKPNSRRQSFITLEKYAEGKPASPSSAAAFTGPLLKTSNSQERSKISKTPSSQTSQTSTSPNSQDSQSTRTRKINLQCPVNNDPESPRRPKDSGMKSEPVRLIDRLQSDTTEDEDVIPDTQTEVESKENTKMASTSEEIKHSSQEEESDQTLDDSPVSQSSPGEPRRSGRHRVRPLLPGEDPEEREGKYTQFKRRRSGSEPRSDSPAQNRPITRSKQAAEEDSSRDRLRTRAQRDRSESSQTTPEGRAHKKIKLYSSSEDFLDKPQPKRRSTREHESSRTDLQSDSQSDYESQSQGRRSRQSKTSVEIKEEGRLKKKVLPEKEESSQTSSHEFELLEETKKDDELEKGDSQITPPSPQTDRKSQEVEHVEQTEKDDQLKKDCQIVTSSLQTDNKSQESELVEKTKKEKRDAQLVDSSPTTEESQDRTSATKELENDEQVKDQHKTKKVTDDRLSQEDSQVITPSSSESQSLRRSRRSKASSETGESDSQTPVTAVSETEARIAGRTRRSKVQEQLKSSPGSTTESSQSQDTAGSESSQGMGRYSRRRSQVANVETSESESSETREGSPMPRKRGRKPRASLQSPLTLESKDTINIDLAKDGSDNSERADTQSLEAKNTDLGDSQRSQGLQDSQSLQVAGNVEEQSNEESPMEVEVDAVVVSVPVAPETMEPDDTKEHRQNDHETNADNMSSLEGGDDTGLLESVERSKQIQDKLPFDTAVVSAVDTLVSSETSEKLQVSEPSEENAEDVSKTGEHEEVGENRKDDSDPQEHPVVPAEDAAEDGQCASLLENQTESPNVSDDLSKDDELSASKQHTEDNTEVGEITPLQEKDKGGEPHILQCLDKEEAKTDDLENDLVAHSACVSAEATHEDVFQDSPAKQKDLGAITGPDVGQSPISGRTRGTWSPSASPSTSILKKGQKRPLEEECLSPLVKVRDCALWCTC